MFCGYLKKKKLFRISSLPLMLLLLSLLSMLLLLWWNFKDGGKASYIVTRATSGIDFGCRAAGFFKE